MIAQNNNIGCRPRLVLGYADSNHAALCARQFRRQGWEVHQTRSGPEARRLAGCLEPALVMLDAELAGESGWLTAAKLLLERPRQKILLVGPERTSTLEQLTAFLGAAGFLTRAECATLLEEELGMSMSA